MGLPRSGKSTWARDQSWPIVCPDAIRLATHGQFFYAPMEPWIWAMAYTMVESLFLSGHRVVLFDSCALTLKSRDELRRHGWDCRFKFFNTDLDVCLKRAVESTNPNLHDVVLRMYKSKQSLLLEEKIYI